MELTGFKTIKPDQEKGQYISEYLPQPQDTLKLEFPALSEQIDTALQQGWTRNELRKFLAERENIALSQYSRQEVNQFLGRDENSTTNLIGVMRKQNDDSYVEIMKYKMSEPKVRDILKTAELSGISPAVLLMNDDPEIKKKAEELAGKRETLVSGAVDAVKNMISNYNQAQSNAQYLNAQEIKNALNDNELLLQKGLWLWDMGVNRTTPDPLPDEELINMGRQSYQKRLDSTIKAAEIDAQDAQDWYVHMRTPDNKLGAIAVSAIENFGFTGMSMIRTMAGWSAGGAVGGLFASLYNTLDESHVEAGEAFVEGIRRGMPPEDAYKAAQEVKAKNLLYLPAS